VEVEEVAGVASDREWLVLQVRMTRVDVSLEEWYSMSPGFSAVETPAI
jgi:hypothetical protein